MKLAFVYMKGRRERLGEVERGEAPTEFFYGAIELSRQGHEVEHFEIDPDAPDQWTERILGRLCPTSIRPVKTTPAVVMQAWRLANALNGMDCIVATGGNIAFALAALACVGVIRVPIVGIQCGVLNFHHGWLRRWISRRLLLRMHTLLFGEAELEPMRRFFDLPAEVISVNAFGVDTQFWRPAAPDATRDIVLAIGNDGRRDFGTLVAGADSIALPVHIVTKMTLPSPLPANVTHHRGSWHGAEVSDAQVRELYQRARVVVVPLRPSGQPSGQSVTLQAMACGAPVVLTRTDGLWSSEQLEDGQNILFVPPADPSRLAERIGEVTGNAETTERLSLAGRRTVEQTGSISAFAGQIGAACARQVVAHGKSRIAPPADL